MNNIHVNYIEIEIDLNEFLGDLLPGPQIMEVSNIFNLIYFKSNVFNFNLPLNANAKILSY